MTHAVQISASMAILRRGVRWLCATGTSLAILLSPLPVRANALFSDTPLLVRQSAPDGAARRSELKVLVLPLTVKGAVPSSVRSQFEETTAEVLRSTNFGAVYLEDCSGVDCAVQKAQGSDVPLVLRQELVARERNYQLTMELIEGSTRRVLATSSERCDLCGIGEVRQLFSARAAVIKDKLESLAVLSANLRVTSEPEGAQVKVDGEMVGLTPLQFFVDPGEHVVEVHKSGHASGRRMIQVVRGVREILEFELHPALSPEDKPDNVVNAQNIDTEPRRLISLEGWGWMTLVVGAGGVGVGSALIGIDEMPYRKDCSGVNVDEAGNCRFRYNTMTEGIATAAVGGALLLSGAILLIVAKRKKRPAKQKPSASMWSPVPGGVLFRF